MVRILTALIAILLATVQICAALKHREALYEQCSGLGFIPHEDNTDAVTRAPHAFGLPDGEYNLRFRGFYLTQPEMGPQSVLLDYDQGLASAWEVINDGQRGIAIRNVNSNMYLAYIDARPNSLLSMTPTPMYWALRQQEMGEGRTQIQALELYEDQVLVIDELPIPLTPPMIGLVLPDKSGEQEGWDIKPTVRSSRRLWRGQARHAYRRPFRWWRW
ncbi:hypothetical protein DFQ26_002962 [Actinomortierella ambigua]|nr:hypothetical protein DFQ26_002962 [Actinomortierella ambigua]